MHVKLFCMHVVDLLDSQVCDTHLMHVSWQVILNQPLSVVFRLIVVELKIQRDLKDSRKEERKLRNKH